MGKENAYDAVLLLCWVLKDFGWVLLLHWLSFPAAVAGICVEVWLGAAERHRLSTGLQVHMFADLCWLIGNATWMTGEFLFDPAGDQVNGRELPWFDGPLLGDSEENYDKFTLISQCIFLLGLVALLGFYLLWAVGVLHVGGQEARSSRTLGESSSEEDGEIRAEASPARQQQKVCGTIPPELYGGMFIGPWLLKDLFWSLEATIPCLAFGFVTMALVLDNLRRFGGDAFRIEGLWILGNIVWAGSELAGGDEARWPRVLVGALFALAGLNILVMLARTCRNADEKHADSDISDQSQT